MSRLKFALTGVFALLLATAAPVAAITYGEPDAGEHPYVGFMVFFDPTAPGWFSCSGTLLDANTLLTAAHCTFDVGTDGEVSPSSSGGSDMWVTFDDTDTLAGWPRRADFPDEATLYAARSAWLNDPANGFTKGIAIPHPDYNGFADFPVNHDVGVVQLDEAVVMANYGDLAPIGTIDELASPSKTKNASLIETVGYGIQAVQPKPQDDDSRYKSTSRIVEVNGNQSDGGNVHTLNNPSATGGVGGSCFGDSGGPLFVNNTDDVVAVVSYGPSQTCHGADYSWRVDTIESQTFIAQYLN